MTLHAIDIPEGCGITSISKAISYSKSINAGFHIIRLDSCLAYSRYIAFDVTKKNRNSGIRKGLSHALHADGFTCTCCTGNESVSIAHGKFHIYSITVCIKTHVNFIIYKHFYLRKVYILILYYSNSLTTM